MANQICEKAFNKDPNDPELLYIQWVIEGRNIGSTSAVKSIMKSISDKADFLYAKLNYARAIAYSDDKDKFYEAYKLLKEIQDKNSQAALAYIANGVLKGREGKLDDAKYLFEKAIEISDEGASAFFDIGNIYFFKGNYDFASKYHELAIDINQSSWKPYYGLGRNYIELKRFNDAIQILEKGIKIEPEPRLHAHLAFAHYQKGLEEVAKYMFDKAVMQDKRCLSVDLLHHKQLVARRASIDLLEKWKVWEHRSP